MKRTAMPATPSHPRIARHAHPAALRLRAGLLCVIGLMPMAELRAAADAAALPPPGPAGSTAYVQASIANLRAQPNPGAPVVALPATNSPVRLIANNGEWCEVELLPGGYSVPMAGSATARRGFLVCGLLTAQPITLATAEARLASGKLDGKTALDWYSRAFWIAPSVGRWVRVGVALEQTLLDDEARNRQYTETKPIRFKVPEFDAMKQRLAAGVLVKPEPGAVEPGLVVDDAKLSHYGYIQAARQRTQMPAIKPSFFKNGETPVTLPMEKFGGGDAGHVVALIDTLSAANGAPFRAEATGSASYVLNAPTSRLAGFEGWRLIRVAGAMGEIVGIWDVGQLRVTYSRDAVLHGVSVYGEPSAQKVKGIELGFGYDSACSYSPSSVTITKLAVAGYAPASSALITWAGKPMPGGASARALVKSRNFSGAGEYDALVTHEIDLDRDGVTDFLVWQGRYQPQLSAEGIWSAVFANVSGQWRLLGYDEDGDCT